MSVFSFFQGCGGEAPLEPGTPPAPERTVVQLPTFVAPENCLFVILDAFHAGHASYIGYERDTTPNLDNLAAEGTGFMKAYSQSANTLSSTFSFMLGQYPPGRPDQEKQLSIAPEDYTLAQAFQAAGFKTAAFTENPWINLRMNFDQGFDKFAYTPPIDPDREGKTYRHRLPNGTKDLIGAARDWISGSGDARWFCYLHLVRPHNPYGAPEPFGARYSKEAHGEAAFFREMDILSTREGVDDQDEHGAVQFLIDRYDANIAYVDHLLGELLTWLTVQGLSEKTLVIVASDHGEAFRQHGRFLHNLTVYEEMIHVPLVIRAPASVGFASSRIQAPVEMVDLYPTLTGLFSLAPKNALDGRSLLPLLFGIETRHKDTFFSQTSRIEQLAVRKGDRKLILKRRGYSRFVPFELYDLSSDPQEAVNLLLNSPAPEDLVALAAWYRQEKYLRPHGGAQTLDKTQEEALRALGYL